MILKQTDNLIFYLVFKPVLWLHPTKHWIDVSLLNYFLSFLFLLVQTVEILIRLRSMHREKINLINNKNNNKYKKKKLFQFQRCHSCHAKFIFIKLNKLYLLSRVIRHQPIRGLVEVNILIAFASPKSFLRYKIIILDQVKQLLLFARITT